MISIGEFISHVLLTNYSIIAITFLSFFFKSFILAACLRFIFKSNAHKLLLGLLLVFLTGCMLNDILSILLNIKQNILGIKDASYPPLTCYLRFVWGIYLTQYQAIALFMYYLLEKRIRFNMWLIVHGLINGALSSVFLYHAFFLYHISARDPYTLAVEHVLIKIIYCYLPFLFIPLLYKIVRKRNSIPRSLPPG